MRFHLGFSKRISWKWLLLIGGGLLAFFGIGNHAVLAASLSATPSSVYARSPRVDTYIPEIPATVPADNLINYDGSCFNATWDGETYCGFQVSSSPRALGYRDSIQNARLRWMFPTSDMNKCSGNQSITYTFDYYLRNISSGTLPQLWKTADLYQNFWIRSSQTNYQCSVASRSGNIATVTCTIPNPTSNVYVYLDGFTIPYGSIIDNGYYNVGIRATQYTCAGLDSGEIIQNNNQNTQQIIDSQNEINNNITNDDVQSGTSHGGNFFNNTQINDHGISIIATAPIRLLQGMLNSGSSCNDLILTSEIFGQNKLITMPSGCILWNRAPSTVVSIYHITVFGLFGYFVLVDIWHTINAVIDPERKNDYVMDL